MYLTKVGGLFFLFFVFFLQLQIFLAIAVKICLHINSSHIYIFQDKFKIKPIIFEGMSNRIMVVIIKSLSPSNGVSNTGQPEGSISL